MLYSLQYFESVITAWLQEGYPTNQSNIQSSRNGGGGGSCICNSGKSQLQGMLMNTFIHQTRQRDRQRQIMYNDNQDIATDMCIKQQS